MFFYEFFKQNVIEKVFFCVIKAEPMKAPGPKPMAPMMAPKPAEVAPPAGETRPFLIFSGQEICENHVHHFSKFSRAKGLGGIGFSKILNMF